MKRKILFCTVFLILITTGANCLGSEKFMYGVKGGISFNRLDYQKGYILNVDEYYYPPGYLLGVSFEIVMNSHFAINSEVNFQTLKLKMNISDDTDFIRQEYKITYLKFPISLKYRPDWHYSPYFKIGPCLNYLHRAHYSATAVFIDINNQNEKNIKDYMPTISTSIDFGIGKDITIFNISFLLEIRGELGFIEKENLLFTPKWYTKGLQFVCGLNFD